jgi:hypothetical protein
MFRGVMKNFLIGCLGIDQISQSKNLVPLRRQTVSRIVRHVVIEQEIHAVSTSI